MTSEFWRGVNALVTGGAGLIGSHIVDRLLAGGANVTILDNLDAASHPEGKPEWIPPAAGFLEGDVRDPADLKRAARNAEVVFHQAAVGGFAAGADACAEVNVGGTAALYETLAGGGTCRKVVVASSQAVYGEGACICGAHGVVRPRGPRRVEDMRNGLFSRACPGCGGEVRPTATPEDAALDGWSAYAVSKKDQEMTALSLGRDRGIPTVALRYAVTYGPRQSLFNPYTGVIAIFTTRLLGGRSPVLYEDGGQLRDFVHVDDVARANLAVAELDGVEGRSFNVGSGKPVSMRDIAGILERACGTNLGPEIRSFRPDDVRDLYLDVTRMKETGWSPAVPLATGLVRTVEWVRRTGPPAERFTEAEKLLLEAGIVRN